MRSTSWLICAAAAVVLCGSAFADELQVPATKASPATGATPTSGMSMESVEAKYGAPSKRVPAVGGASAQQPPITRWEYPGFVVFFENNHVIHTVITPG
jgi:hypothetical protein